MENLGEREGVNLSTGETTVARPRSAIIDSRIKIRGQIFSMGDLYLDGDFEGSVELPNHKLTVGRNGTITAEIKAQDVVVLGMTRSNIEANDRTEIRKGANFGGNIKTARIVIEDGVHFQGSVEIVKPKPATRASTSVARSAKSARLK
jgi:cytoskeletal protein CcmA (bactofilin family)